MAQVTEQVGNGRTTDQITPNKQLQHTSYSQAIDTYSMTTPFQSIDTNVAEVQPLHQEKRPQMSNLEHQRQLLAMKIAENDGKFASPTDSMMSPCTAKLQANKKRHYNKYADFEHSTNIRAKPQSLQSRFSQVVQQSEKEN